LLSAVTLSMAGMLCAAETPEIINDFKAYRVSPDGRYIAGDGYSSVYIKDLQDNKTYDYVGDQMTTDYSVGHGNAWSANGILVGSTVFDGDASYWKDGKWHQIASCAKYPMAFTNAITADGKMIVGDVSNLENEETAAYSGLMMVPALWEDKDGNGEYETELLLPHPDKDLFGATPQYVNALNVSEDGKVIAGQVVDCTGFYCYPIMWKQNAGGKWEYSYPGINLFNPDKLVLPEFPGESCSAEYPEAQNFMTDEEKATWQAAYNAWVESGYSTEYPEPKNYMTAEEWAAYEAAMEAYNKAYEEWSTLYAAWSEVYYAILDSSPVYEFNSSTMSAGGRWLVQNAVKQGETFWDPSFYYAVRLDLWTGDAKCMPTAQNVVATCVGENGAMIGTELPSMMSTKQQQAYICPAGADEFVLLYDHFKSVKPEYATWMEQNMAHDIESYDPETFEPVTLKDVLVTGAPYCNKDMTTIVCGVESVWASEYEFYSYLFGGLESGIRDITAPASTMLLLKAMRGGDVIVSGEAASIAVYDINGRQVYSAAEATGVVSTGLPSGIYIVKALDAAGHQTIVKAAF
ncbi:MAG: T9SS type A sorting domain-containing protein, partial [Muribaculaceae bacterium]|nr:T9SS type A sorting domain-containing protein [Muribaculaceae bacterium]